MKRKLLLDLLTAYKPTEAEETFKKEIVRFVHQHEDCFERSLAIGHVTASSWLLSKDHRKALIMHHKKLNNWFQLGGHCDGDNDVHAVAIKETQEESGILAIESIFPGIYDIDVHMIPENKKEKAHFHYDIRFLLHVTNDEPTKINNEAKELRWIGPLATNLPTDNPAVRRLFDKWILMMEKGLL